MSTAFDFGATTIDGHELSLRTFEGKVLLVVNTASKCGFTGQYAGLQGIYHDYQPRGLEVLGFPCNQFAKQEPGSEDEIKTFCERNYGVTFPLFAKIHVNGRQTHPLYAYLKEHAPGLLGSRTIKWNFTKFLVDRSGLVLRRFAPTDSPESLRTAIENALATPQP